MSKIAYHLQLKGYVGCTHFNRNAVDEILRVNDSKAVNVLIDSLSGTETQSSVLFRSGRNHSMARTLTDIKSYESIVEFFAVGMNKFICQILRHSFSNGDCCIVTSPMRRHNTRNFASLISARFAIPIYEYLAECHSKHRVGAVSL